MRRATVLALSALVLASCGSRGSQVETITIGAVLPQSGEFAQLGRSMRDGVQLALDIAAPEGTWTLRGRTVKLTLHVEDDRGDAVAGETAVRRLSEQRVAAIIGGVQAAVARAAARAAEDRGVVLLVPSATDPAVLQGTSWTFRVCFNDRAAGVAMAAYAVRALGARRAAVLFDRTAPYNATLAAAFTQTFRARGRRIVAEAGFDDERATSDFRPMLDTMRPLRPDVLFTPNYYRATARIAVQAREAGLRVALLSGEGANSPDLPLLGAEAVEGLAYPVHFALDDASRGARQFRDRYRRAYGRDPDAMAALGYDAMRLLLDALRRAPSSDPKGLRTALGATQSFEGATGTIAYTGPGEPHKDVIVVRVRGGRPVFHVRIRP